MLNLVNLNEKEYTDSYKNRARDLSTIGKNQIATLTIVRSFV